MQVLNRNDKTNAKSCFVYPKYRLKTLPLKCDPGCCYENKRSNLPGISDYENLDIIKHIRKVRYVACGTPNLEAALDAVGCVPVEVALDLAPWSLTRTYISPVASEETNIRPCLSNAIPTGLKQLLGQTELSALAKMSTVAVVLLAGATGSPLANAIRDTLYPIGIVRSLSDVSNEIARSRVRSCCRSTYQLPWKVIHASVPLLLKTTSSGAVWAWNVSLGAICVAQ